MNNFSSINCSFDTEAAKLSSNVSNEWNLHSSAYNTRNHFTWIQDVYRTAWHSDIVSICQVWKGWQLVTSKAIRKGKVSLHLIYIIFLKLLQVLLFCCKIKRFIIPLKGVDKAERIPLDFQTSYQVLRCWTQLNVQGRYDIDISWMLLKQNTRDIGIILLAFDFK